LAKSRNLGHRQQAGFAGELEASWAELPTITSQQLLEVECDLITSHVMHVGAWPAAQFLG
jgi:hypothetical protein